MAGDELDIDVAYDRESSPGYLVSLASRLFAGVLRDRLAAFGVTPAQVPIILWLHEEDGLIQKELSERASIEQPSAAEMLARMERDGLVGRTADATDRRRFRYHLTPRARAMADMLKADAVAGNELAFAGLTEAETETFLALLRRMIGNLRDDQRVRGAPGGAGRDAA